MKRKYELFPLDLRSRTQTSERYCFRFVLRILKEGTVVVVICCSTIPLVARPGIRTSGHTKDSFRIAAPPQRSTEDVRSWVGCHPKETLHCCQSLGWCLVLPVLFQHTQDVHHLLWPYWQQSSLSRDLSVWTFWHWRLWFELPQARKEAGTLRLKSPREHGTKDYRKRV